MATGCNWPDFQIYITKSGRGTPPTYGPTAPTEAPLDLGPLSSAFDGDLPKSSLETAHVTGSAGVYLSQIPSLHAIGIPSGDWAAPPPVQSAP